MLKVGVLHTWLASTLSELSSRIDSEALMSWLSPLLPFFEGVDNASCSIDALGWRAAVRM